jgi:predicted HicB family RNase H-like nuclease
MPSSDDTSRNSANGDGGPAINFRLGADLHRRAKLASVRQGVSLRDFIREAVKVAVEADEQS